jgi:LmbE family N-acetylglucosaminyl deacetylase
MVPALGEVVVLSTHLDDAAFSLGAWIHATTREGGSVLVVTVLGGDPSSPRPSGSWDRRAGFTTEGEAARVRREEDAAVWRRLGASSQVLSFGDATYGRGATDDEIWSAIDGFTAAANTVLAPGWPLGHPDHLWLSDLTKRRCTPDRLRLYREQPYASHQPDPCGGGDGWKPLPSGRIDRREKRRALALYRSQLPMLGGRRVLRAVSRSEARCGGEAVHGGTVP